MNDPAGTVTTRRIVVTEHTEADYRTLALREAIGYFAYVRRADPTPPPGARIVLEMADHFAAYLRDGTLPGMPPE